MQPLFHCPTRKGKTGKLTEVGRIAVFLCLCLFPGPAQASSNRSLCINHLRMIGIACEYYRETYGNFPTDIVDEKGNALLSWRVRLLPFLEEDRLFREFHLNEPWDSENNLPLATKMPRVFSCPSCPTGNDSTCHVIPRGEQTVLPRNRSDDWREIPGDRSTTIVLIEVDADQAVVWTKPTDWDYEPTRPTQGLAKHHSPDFSTAWGCLALFGDGMVRFIPLTIDPDMLRSMFSIEEAKNVQFRLPWYLVLRDRPISIILAISVVISLFGMVGIFVVVPRVIQRKSISPGEFLWLIVGSEQLAHLIVVLTSYDYSPAPRLIGMEDPHWKFWFLPCLIGTVTSSIPVIWFRRLTPWQVFFAAMFGLFILFALDARFPYQHRASEESFLTAVSPSLLGFASVAMAWMSLSLKGYPAKDERRLFHWAGIVICLLPFLWFVVCCSLGVVYPRQLGVRIRE